MLAIAPIAMTFHMAHGGRDPAGPDPKNPRGGDLIQFWVGAAALNRGTAARDLYDDEAFARAYETVESGRGRPGFGPSYPPVIYQVFDVFEGLGRVRGSKLLLWGFLLAYAIGSALLLRAAGLDVLRNIEAWLLLFAAPASQLGIATGQPASIWLLLLGGGLVLWRSERSLAAGAVLGVLCVKPTLAAPVAFAFLLAQQWRVLCGFALGGASVLVVSIAVSGAGIWYGYFEMLIENPDLPQRLWFGLERHFSLRSLVAVPFAGSGWAVPVGTAGSIAGVGFAVWLRVRLAPIFARNPQSFPAFALLLAGAAFATPHLLDYDLVLYFPLMIWASYRVAERRAQHMRAGFAILLCFYLVPIAYPVSEQIHFSVGSLVLMVFLGWCTHEVVAES